jgi:hypothetical protein
MNPFLSLRNYEEFVYTLKQRFSLVQGSTLTVIPRGKRMAIVQGEIAFAHGYRITLKERLSFDEGPVVNTHPHHKHLLPDIKHHRIPAPDMSFTQPNLPALIREIEELLKE